MILFIFSFGIRQLFKCKNLSRHMSNYQYEQQLSRVVDNALLYLWITVAGMRGYTRRSVRNQLLVSWLKPKVKDSQYKLIKKELKEMLLAGKHPESQLEESLCELSKLSTDYKDKLTDMHRFYYLLECLRMDHSIHADLSDNLEYCRVDTIYAYQKDVEECFCDNNQIKPLRMFVLSSELDNVIRLIGKSAVIETKGSNQYDISSFFLYISKKLIIE